MMALERLPLDNARELFGSEGAVEASWAWFHTLSETTLTPGEISSLVVCRDNTGMAGLALATSERGSRALTAPYTTRFGVLATSEEAAFRLGCEATVYAGGVLRLDGLDPDDPFTVAFEAGLRQSGLTSGRYTGFANWYEPVDNFEIYWARRPSRLRTTVRRKSAAAEKVGATFLCLRHELETVFDLYEEIRRASWKEGEPYPEFLPSMVRALGREGLVRIGLMTIAARPVAAQIWLVSRGRATLFKLVHREDVAELSPGTLLTWWMLRTLMQDETITEIDFGRGDDAYKRDWVGFRRYRMGVIAADWRCRNGLEALWREIIPTWVTGAIRRHVFRNRHISAAAQHNPTLPVTGESYTANKEMLSGPR